MKKLCLVFAVALFAAPLFAQDVSVRCESGGKMNRCGFTGAGTVTLMRQLSKSACVQGKSWGYSGNTIWVDNGCRADFVVSPYNASVAPMTSAVVCESDGKLRHCNADTRFGVQISHQLSKHSCVEGKSWGYDSRGVWVDDGCRAEFITGARPMTSSSTYHGTVVCESVNNVRHRCSADTRFGVQMSRQLSKDSCVINSTWGFDSRGIWVTKGCRAEFALGTP